MQVQLAALLVDDYDRAIRFFVDVLRFELVEDSPSETERGQAKRWVVVRPPGAETGLLLARADGAGQMALWGRRLADGWPFFSEWTTSTLSTSVSVKPEWSS
jgi:catechol 2,3-dioxygenase-like lactoylglutathione lyase family enzyme